MLGNALPITLLLAFPSVTSAATWTVDRYGGGSTSIDGGGVHVYGGSPTLSDCEKAPSLTPLQAPRNPRRDTERSSSG